MQGSGESYLGQGQMTSQHLCAWLGLCPDSEKSDIWRGEAGSSFTSTKVLLSNVNCTQDMPLLRV